MFLIIMFIFIIFQTVVELKVNVAQVELIDVNVFWFMQAVQARSLFVKVEICSFYGKLPVIHFISLYVMQVRVWWVFINNTFCFRCSWLQKHYNPVTIELPIKSPNCNFSWNVTSLQAVSRKKCIFFTHHKKIWLAW